MPVTAEQRATARRIARERQAFHTQNGDPDYQIADGISGEEAHYRGILAEFEFSNVFGTEVDLEQKRDGDDGNDAHLLLNEGRFPVNVKASGYLGPDPYLRVPQRELKRRMIYIAARYDEHIDDVELVGWEWGMVMAHCPLMSFSSGGTLNHVKHYGELRSIDELKRHIRPLTAFVHYCHCGKWGAFGYGVSLLKNKLGTWYCYEHRPNAEIPHKQPPQGQLSLL